jgi:hypothetical protein
MIGESVASGDILGVAPNKKIFMAPPLGIVVVARRFKTSSE